MTPVPRLVTAASLAALMSFVSPAQVAAQDAQTGFARPFGTLREQADVQQRWLAERLRTVLPPLMRKHGIDTWVVPMREYNEDPVFSSLVSPTTFAARRRTIYVFHDLCAGKPRCAPADTVQRIALGGTSQGGLYEAVRSTAAPSGPAGARGEQLAELWGSEQWQALRRVLEARSPRRIGVNVSRTFAFSDGLSAGEADAMREALGPALSALMVPAEALPLELIASRLPAETAEWRKMNALAWAVIDTAFSSAVITPGVTRVQDVVWWMRQRVQDLGLSSWFQPSVEVQRHGSTEQELGSNPVILEGDVLHCDFGLTAMRLNTDTQHMGYVLRAGERGAPAGLRRALAVSNRLQDIVVDELRPGRTGDEILRAARSRMRDEGIDGTIYSHPIGMHGHGAGPLIGLWDRQEGVPDRGAARVIPGMWYSIELQATSPVPEWGGQRVRSAQEEDVYLDEAGVPRWAHRRQVEFHLVGEK